jgi:hypothetical protein
MPNWCNNSIVIQGDKDKIKTILEKIGDINSDCNLFENLIGKDPDIDTIGWYESNLRRFGTKWDVSPNESNIEFCDDKITMSPQTAWSPPVYFCEALSKDYGVKVELTFYEPGCDFAGRVTFDENGEVVEELDYTYYEGLFHMDNESFWTEIDEYYFPLDYEKTPDDYVKENFFYLNADDKDKVVEKYKDYILDQHNPEDEED